VSTPTPTAAATGGGLPELDAVRWRRRVDERELRRRGTGWTISTLGHVIPFTVTGIVLFLVEPLALPVSLAAFAQGWILPELYAQRGANVVRPKKRAAEGPERVALGLLGDLLGHEARDLHARTGLVMERGRLGVWLLGEGGALLVRGPRGRRVHCYCVRVNHPELPSSDRIAHLLLALREDEAGFATVANHSFSGARWRVRRRVPKPMRPALDAAGASLVARPREPAA
jgi:hypothetical protein